MKKAVVIGAGIAGLNAGIELLQKGFDVTIYEKNNEVGGLCSGYFVNGYNIDACLHWLMGTKKDTTLNALWRNIDALNDDVKISHLPYFCSFIYKGIKVTFSRNLDEEEQRWLELSPNDKKAINSFFDCVRDLAKVWNVTQSLKHKRFTTEILKVLPNFGKISRAMKLSREEYSKKFTHPALRFAIKNAMTGYNNAYFFMQVYGLFSTGDGDVPLGGAYYMTQRIKNKFLSLGGKLELNSPVEELIIKDRKVTSIRVNNKVVEADYFISALDVNYTLNTLLNGKHKSMIYKYANKHLHNSPISSCFCVYIKVEDYKNNIDVPTCILTEGIKVGVKKAHSLLIRPYSFDATFDYHGDSVISLFVDLNQDDYLYFKKLKHYQKEHRRIVNDLINAFKEAYPEYKDKISSLTSFGPIELNERTNTSYGALQSYSFSNKGIFVNYSGKIRSISNLYMCGQWNRSIGGTPTALLTSHQIVKKLVRKDKRFFKFRRQ